MSSVFLMGEESDEAATVGSTEAVSAVLQALSRGSEVALNTLAFGFADGVALRQDYVYASALAYAQNKFG